MTLQGLLFDLDGTLIDSAEDLANAYNQLRQQHQLLPLPIDSLKPAVAYGINPLICRDFDISLKDPRFPSYRRDFTEHYTRDLTKHTRLFPGVDTLLQYLDEQEIPWGIVSNKPKRFALPIVDAFPTFKQARCVIAGDTLSYNKPHPHPLQHACNALNTTPANTGMVGDTEIDIQAAQAAGCPSFAVSYGYQQPTAINSWDATAIIDHPMDVLPWLTQKARS